VLATVPAFAGCSRRELATIDSLTVELQLPASHVLARQGRPVGELVFVVSGRVALVRDGSVVGVLDEYACIGAPELFSAGVHDASAITLTNTVVRVASPREARSLTHAVPRLAHLRLAPVVDLDEHRPGSNAATYGIGVTQ
jgi:CRP-like cAMP-binding protein